MAATRHHLYHRTRLIQHTLNLDATQVGSSRECWVNTGGTCRILGCDADRGSTQCISKNWLSSWCVCSAGLCATINGSCAAIHYEVVASNFTLTNVKWPNYRLFADSCGDSISSHAPLSVNDSDSSAKSRWSLTRVADPYGAGTNYLLTPMEYPNCVVSDLTKYPMVARRDLSGLDGSGIHLERAPHRPGVLSMHSVKQNGKYFYVPETWQLAPSAYHIALYSGEPTDSGMWQTDPSLPASVWS